MEWEKLIQSINQKLSKNRGVNSIWFKVATTPVWDSMIHMEHCERDVVISTG